MYMCICTWIYLIQVLVYMYMCTHASIIRTACVHYIATVVAKNHSMLYTHWFSTIRYCNISVMAAAWLSAREDRATTICPRRGPKEATSTLDKRAHQHKDKYYCLISTLSIHRPTYIYMDTHISADYISTQRIAYNVPPHKAVPSRTSKICYFSVHEFQALPAIEGGLQCTCMTLGKSTLLYPIVLKMLSENNLTI